MKLTKEQELKNSPSIKVVRSVREQVSDEEWRKRVDLAACYRLVDYYGMTELTANHISARVPGTQNEFLINPYGMLYDEITASSLIRIDLNGDILFNPTEFGVNKAGFVIHGAIHAGRHDVDCAAHTHTVAGMAVSTMKCGLMPLVQTSMRFYDVGYHDYDGLASEIENRDQIVKDLGNREAMIMRNHGLLAVGPTIPACFRILWMLERACQVQLAALSANTEVTLPNSEVLKATSQRQVNHPKKVGYLNHPWRALLRKLDRIDPSYKQ